MPEPPLECAALEQHMAVACQAAEPDIGADPHNAPGITATRVRLAHLDDIIWIEGDRWWHQGRLS
jgi:hypothetical protein